jgi:drug/metabolite transporter (DMT)-like permease
MPISTQPLSPQTKYIVGAILVFVSAVCFSAKAVMVKLAYQHYPIDATSLLMLRMLFSAPFYAIGAVSLSKKKENVKFTVKEWAIIAGLGITGYYAASFFDFKGLAYISASVERLILFIYPTLVLIMTALFFKKPITKIQYLALFLTYLGIVFAFASDIEAGVQKNLALGAMFIFLSSFTYAMYLVGSGDMIPKVGAMKFTCYAMLFSTVAVFVHYLVERGCQFPHYPIGLYQLAIGMALISTVLPTFLMAEGMNLIGSSNASLIGAIGPISTIILAHIFLDERISGMQLIGTFIVLGGVLMISWKGTK